MRIINIFFISLLVPFLGLLSGAYLSLQQNASALHVPVGNLEPYLLDLTEYTLSLEENIGFIQQSVEEQQLQQLENELVLKELAQRTDTQKKLSDEIYEQRILNRLGPPVNEHSSERVEIKIFELKGLGYRGYIAKIKLHDPSVFKVVLSNDKLGESETTSTAVRRTNAVLGINAGGFFRLAQDGKEYTLPIGNTMIDSKFIDGFKPSHNDLFLPVSTARVNYWAVCFSKKTS